MTQFPSDGYVNPDGKVTPLDVNRDLYGEPSAPAELVPVDDAVNQRPPSGASAASTPAPPEDSLRMRAEKIVNARSNFRRKLVGFTVVNAMLWIVYLSQLISGSATGDDRFPWPAFVTVFWGMAMIRERQALRELERQDSAVDQEMQRLRQQNS